MCSLLQQRSLARHRVTLSDNLLLGSAAATLSDIGLPVRCGFEVGRENSSSQICFLQSRERVHDGAIPPL